MTRLQSLDTKSAETNSFGLTNYDKLQAAVDYLVVAGANLAALDTGNTLTIASEFHHVTLAGGNNVDNITDASGAAAGQQVRLLFDNAQTIRNNGGGTGNIRTKSGSDRAVNANEILTLAFDGTYWREQGSGASGLTTYTWATLPITHPAGEGAEVFVADTINGVKGVWPLIYNPAGDATYPYKIVGDDGTGSVVAAPRMVVFTETTSVASTTVTAVGSFTLPFAGKVIFGSVGHTNGGTVTIQFGSTSTGSQYASLTGASGNLGEAAVATVAAAGSTIFISKKTSSGSFTSQISAEYLRPVRVAGQA